MRGLGTRNSRSVKLGLVAVAVAVLLGSATVDARVSEGAEDSQAKKGTKAPEVKDDARRRRLRMQRNDRILNRKEIEAAMAPHVSAISACYKQHAASQKRADGHISLEMLVRPEGVLQRLWVVAPSIRGAKLSKCIVELSKAWRFPKKPGFTNAVVPFYFQKSRDPGAGPFRSCWSAKGCPEQRRRGKR